MVKVVGKTMEAKGNNLYLLTRPGGSQWVYRAQVMGRRMELHLGSVDELTLRGAREKVAAITLAVAEGRSPRSALSRPTTARTLGEAVADYVTATAPSWRGEKEKGHFEKQMLRYWGSRYSDPIQTITKEDILAVLKDAAASPSVYEKLLSRTKRVFRRERMLDHLKAQPIEWESIGYVLKPAHKPVQHHPAVRWQDAPAFWAKLMRSDAPSRHCLALIILTATRSGEARGATWAEFSGLDGDKPVWVITAARMKAARDHVIPLSTQAVDLLRAIRRQTGKGGMLFPGDTGKGVSDMAVLKTARRIDEWNSVHGWRSSFRDWGAESEVDPVLLELSLAHAVGGAVERAYARSNLVELRRPVMQRWADHVTKTT